MARKGSIKGILFVIGAILAAEVLLYTGLTALISYWSGYSLRLNFFRYFLNMPLLELTIFLLGASLVTLLVKDLNGISNGCFLFTLLASVITSVKAVQFMLSVNGNLMTLADYSAELILLVGIVLLCLYNISFRNLGKAAYWLLIVGAVAGFVVDVIRYVSQGGVDALWGPLPRLLIVAGTYWMTATYAARRR